VGFLNSIKLLKNEGNYRKLFFAGLINGIGDRFNQVALFAFILSITGSGLAIGAALSVRIIPYLIFAPYGSWLTERFSKKTIMITTDLARVLVALSFLLVRTVNDIWFIYVGLFLLAAGEAIYQPIRKTMIVEEVEENHLFSINTLEQALLGVVLVFGSATGGFVSHFFSPQFVFILNAISFLLAGFIIFFIHTKQKDQSKIVEKQSLWLNMKNGFLYLRKNTILLRLFTIDLLIPLADGMFNVLISYYAFKKFEQGDVGIGIFYGALGLGLIISMWMPTRFKNLFRAGSLAMVFEGVFQSILSQTNSFILAISLFSFISLSSGVGNANYDTLLMKTTDKQERGAVFALFEMIKNVMIGISMIVAGFLLTYFSPQLLGFAAGLFYVLVGVSAFGVSYFRKKDKHLQNYEME
jgi:MFS family permease